MLFAVIGGMASIAAASAADMRAPIYKAPPAVAPFSWTGFYVGATAGAGWTQADPSLSIVNGAIPLYIPADIPGLSALGSPGLSGTNAIVGAKAGYNQQWGAFVGGIEGDISWFHFNKTVATAGAPFLTFPAGTAAFSTTVSTNWLATIRGRAGYAVNKALFYATGGVAIGDVRYSNTYVGFSPLGSGFEFEAATVSQTRVGWTAGAGIDYAITPHWVVSGEYLHVDFGSVSTSGLVTTGSTRTATFNISTKLTSDIGRVGIAYKF
ncbi:outer membrane protein [Bradyrhizobium sp. GCM10027634]|uniref:outer membrane protein n=1 Tax=unclassified Bradyrhizobium TaxID=2631580 RepID=UPI001FEE09E1|nr:MULTISPECIES: outer membrane beta-barrel protein [unclassified Bradyrhizobium]MDN5003772.1 outer membrane beta-barrel protein [Bradyrhizobium sp. WYCCWR 12677]